MVIVGCAYLTEVIKSKEVKITDEFYKNFLLPSIEAVYMYDLYLKNCHNQVINHNSKNIDLLNTNYKKVLITITNENNEYAHVCYCKKNDGVVLYDVHSNPFIFVVTENFLVNNEKSNIDENLFNNFIDSKFNNFIRKEIFTVIFQIAYDKLKTAVAY